MRSNATEIYKALGDAMAAENGYKDPTIEPR